MQTPCKKKIIWQTIWLDELCEECARREERRDDSSTIDKEVGFGRSKQIAKIGRKR